jgi:hypothetical protein
MITIQAHCKKKVSKLENKFVFSIILTTLQKKDSCIKYCVDSGAFSCLQVQGLYIIDNFFL